MIEIIGLGPGDFNCLPVKNLNRLREAENLWLRTGKHPVAKHLSEQGIEYQTFDSLYEQAGDFTGLYRQIVARLKEMSARGPVSYAVPGHPLVAEDTVKLLTADPAVEARIYPAMSCIDAVFAFLGVDPVDGKGVTVVDALSMDGKHLDPTRVLLVLQAYNRRVCSDLKLTLMEKYPDDMQVCLVRAAGISGMEEKMWLPLYELDRHNWVDHLTSVYIPAAEERQTSNVPLDPLTDIMATLRGEHGCPWDRRQNHRSLRRYVIEEAYEVADAIDQEDMNKLCEELGDLLLQVVFHAQIAKENSCFDMNDVLAGIVSKMVRRHPHVFGEAEVTNTGEVLHKWEEIKAREREGTKEDSIINVPLALPGLMLAEKAQSQAARVGFDWDRPEEALLKVFEEVTELTEAVTEKDMVKIKEEIGDLLFSVVNVTRLLKLEPEEVLKQAVNKFIGRFRYMEKKVREQGAALAVLNLEQLEKLWQESKKYTG